MLSDASFAGALACLRADIPLPAWLERRLCAGESLLPCLSGSCSAAATCHTLTMSGQEKLITKGSRQ